MHIQMLTLVHMHTNAHAHTHTLTYMHAHAHAHSNAHTHAHSHSHAQSLTCIYILTCTLTRTNACAHIHTHTHTQVLVQTHVHALRVTCSCAHTCSHTHEHSTSSAWDWSSGWLAGAESSERRRNLLRLLSLDHVDLVQGLWLMPGPGKSSLSSLRFSESKLLPAGPRSSPSLVQEVEPLPGASQALPVPGLESNTVHVAATSWLRRPD